MATVIDKLEVGDHVINQPFLHQSPFLFQTKDEYKEITRHNIRVDTTSLPTSGLRFLEYAFITFNDCPISTCMIPKINTCALYSRQTYTYFNKIYPLQCEDLYDSETNALLKNMVRTDMKNVFFVPFRMMKNGSLIDIENIDTLQFDIIFGENVDPPIINIYIKLADKNSEKIDKLNYLKI